MFSHGVIKKRDFLVLNGDNNVKAVYCYDLSRKIVIITVLIM